MSWGDYPDWLFSSDPLEAPDEESPDENGEPEPDMDFMSDVKDEFPGGW